MKALIECDLFFKLRSICILEDKTYLKSNSASEFPSLTTFEFLNSSKWILPNLQVQSH
jgi:hypothetical protein